MHNPYKGNETKNVSHRRLSVKTSRVKVGPVKNENIDFLMNFTLTKLLTKKVH